MSGYDVVIIGGGAAGLSAALVLSRARRRVAVIDAGAPRNAPAAHMHGFLSRDGLPPIPGVRERWGKDLLHCPYCHGYEVRDQPVAVLGGTPDAVAHAQLVRQWTADIMIFPHTDTLTADRRQQLAARAIGILDGPVRRLVVDDDRLSGVEFKDGRVVGRAAVFVRPRFVPNDDLLLSLGCAVDDQGWVVADAVGRTTVSGVWAAGNAANPRAQVVTAAGEGSAAAIALNADLVDDDVREAVQDHRRLSP